MLDAPKGLRLHIGIFGERNAGKSSLLNALTNQKLSIVSEIAGTTTDPVEKATELFPVGPVVFIDTAGIDDVGALGAARVARSLSVLSWIDIAIVAINGQCNALNPATANLLNDCRTRATPILIALTQCDLGAPSEELLASLKRALPPETPIISTSAHKSTGMDVLRAAISHMASKREPDHPLTQGLVKACDTVLLVTPMDIGAPKGRLILPQVQTLRELLDVHARIIVIQVDALSAMLNELKHPPALIITDSQVVHDVARIAPAEIPLTTFSILMSAAKCDMIPLAQGAAAIERLRDGDKVLIMETCSHHPQKDDIGRVKIPRWLREYTAKNLDITVAAGREIPSDFRPYQLLIQCGGCVVTRRHMLARLAQALAQGVPMTNYGMAISAFGGLIERVLSAHPEALAAYHTALLTNGEAHDDDQ